MDKPSTATATAEKIISSDTHVFESPEVWAGLRNTSFGDRAPRLLREADGGDYWWGDGRQLSWLSAGVQPGVRLEDKNKLSKINTWDKVCQGGYIPSEALKAMDADGVTASVLYPTVGLILYYAVKDPELLDALFAELNDWLAQFCKAAPARLKGIGALNLDSVPKAVKELERCAGMGLAGALIPVYDDREGKGYGDASYEPLWEAAEALRMPLSLHIGTNRLGAGFGTRGAGERTPAAYSNVDHWVRNSFADLIFSGVVERHPGLQFGSIEHEAAWLPHFLDRMDYTYSERFQKKASTLKLRPSEYFHRNMFATFTEDRLGVRMRHDIGVGNLHWGSDYPHIESTWPQSRRFIDDHLAECTSEERHRMVAGNVAAVYRIS